MMADNIEHVISYWVIFQKFQSPTLAGFAVISHWVPFLLFSIWSGALADKYDPRRVIQWGMYLFMLVTLAWGILFLTDRLEVWHAVILLVIHGFAGVLWGPAAQMMIHDIVGLFDGFTPKHARKYATLTELISTAVCQYAKDVKDGTFPTAKESYGMKRSAPHEVTSNP